MSEVRSPFHVANYLTFIRILISPIFLLLYIKHDWLGISSVVLPYTLLFLITISELSDAFDGYLARKYQYVSDFGKLLDPMADSIARISALFTFTQPPVNLPLILVFIFLYRDSIISTLRTICALKGFALAARTSGKLKAIIQAATIIFIVSLLIPHSLGYLSSDMLQTLSSIVVGLAGCYTIYSGFDYIRANKHYVGRLLENC